MMTRLLGLAQNHAREWLASAAAPALVDYLCEHEFLYTVQGDREIDELLGRNTKSRWQHGSSCRGWVIHGVDPFSKYFRCAWCHLKPDDPRTDARKNKPIKYESPVGEPLRAVFLPNPWWHWSEILSDKSRPILLVEGEKKSAALISNGFFAVSLPGIFTGYRTDPETGERALIPDLELLAGHPVKFCFDVDFAPETRRNVDLAIWRTGELLQQAGSTVEVIRLSAPGSTKVAVDDLIAERELEVFNACYDQAISLAQFRAEMTVPQLTYPATHVNQRYLDLELPERGFVVIRSPMGSGKTEQTRRIVNQFERVLVLNHLVSLSRQSAERLGLPHYKEARAEQVGRLVCSVDSLYRLAQAKPFDLLLIDEVGQVLDHLLNSCTCSDLRERILQTLAYHIKNAGLVIIQEHQVSDVEIDYIRQLRGDEQPLCFVNDYRPQPRQIRWLSGPKSTVAISEIKSALDRGERILVPTNSKLKAKALERFLQSLFTSKVFRAIHGDNSGDVDSVDFLEHINERVKTLDCLIYSPSVRSGVSIDVLHFDRVVAIFESGRVPSLELEQSLFRYRPPVPITVWSAVRGRGHIGDTVPGVLLEQERASNKRSGLLLGVDTETGELCDGPHLEAWAEVNARKNASLLRQRESLRELLLAGGHQIFDDVLGEDPEIQELMKQAKTAIRQEHAIAIEEAPDLRPGEREMLDYKDSLTEEERFQIEKYDLAQTTRLEVTAELVLMDEDHGLKTAIVAREELQEPDLAKERDLESLHFNFIPDRRHGYQKAIARQLLELSSFLEPGRTWTKDSLQEWRERVIDPYRKDIERTLGLRIPEKAASTWILGKLLAQLGVPTACEQLGPRGQRRRVYQVDRESEVFQTIEASLEKRQASRSRRGVKTPCTDPSYRSSTPGMCAPAPG